LRAVTAPIVARSKTLAGFVTERFCSKTLCRPYAASPAAQKKGTHSMLWTIAVILLVLWLLGFSLHIAGGLIHILLVIALIVGLVQLFSGRRSV
jgi:hypothetical protein